MKTSLYSVSAPLFIKTLKNLGAILDTAEAHAAGNPEELERLLNDRLIEDMFPFGKQIEMSCDTAKNGVARVTGTEAPSFADGDYSFATLTKRVKDTVAYLETVTEASFEGAEDREITLSYYPDAPMSGFGYMTEFALPNFFFHVTVAYAILRKNGVQLKKSDYIGSMPFLTNAA